MSKLYWRDWAWECVRRNQTYQADTLACVSSGSTDRRLQAGGLLSIMHDSMPRAELWELCTFADPALTALQAHHVWLPEAGLSVFPAAAKRASAPGNASIFFPTLSCLEQIMIDARGRQHVVLRGNEAALQLAIEGSAIADEPVDLTFLVHGFSAVRAASEHLSTLRRILSPTARALTPPRWTPTTRKLRDALLTFDGRMAGASYYEIAIVLHGAEYVALNWRTGLKERIRRHFSRGLALSAGGYRKFLR